VIYRALDGQPEGLARDDVLDNATLTWLTDTALSGARLYWENKFPFFGVKGVSIRRMAVLGKSFQHTELPLEAACCRPRGLFPFSIPTRRW
jgi:hypothetical protein